MKVLKALAAPMVWLSLTCGVCLSCGKGNNTPPIPTPQPNEKLSAVEGWPKEYEGVMLQGFYWDSFKETKWTQLEAQAQELGQFFSLVWIPQSGRSKANPSMGYDPLFWYNQNSSFGTEAELRRMIKTFSTYGIGTIADVVINHRETVSTWTDFPRESYKGKEHYLTHEDITRDDEATKHRYTLGKNRDTGDNWEGMRDLDHLSKRVQEEVIDYLKFLRDDIGYVGFRYDLVKGYGARFTRLYNQGSKAKFSVGEYWDGSYDKVKEWLDGTATDDGIIQSAAFDFPNKYALNEACNKSQWDKLMWRRNYTLPQPAGLIHMDGLQRYAITFVDNHDTERNANDAVSSNIMAANAFILTMPGTPCIFYKHWKTHKEELKGLIKARRDAGIHSQSLVKVLETNSSGYVAEVTGKKSKLIVKIGAMSYQPSADFKPLLEGDNYKVWKHMP